MYYKVMKTFNLAIIVIGIHGICCTRASGNVSHMPHVRLC